eukprot:TRINITY_DN904_c0_g1_i5.p1 TRINITY_DN904_c0_g1~~TRINITY_DN904_c0_g1_i5.p1  ORF type:complete len:300 (+),score=115.41 TRINITY_DN904_c0_g1_i5:115-1014(+)
MIVVLIITNLLTTLYVEAFNTHSNRTSHEVILKLQDSELENIRKELDIRVPWWKSQRPAPNGTQVYRIAVNEQRWSRTVKVTTEQKLYELQEISRSTGVDILEMQRDKQLRNDASGGVQQTIMRQLLLATGAMDADDKELPEMARRLKEKGQRHMTKKERKAMEKRNRTHSTVVTTMNISIEDADSQGRFSPSKDRLSPIGGQNTESKMNNRRISVNMSGGVVDGDGVSTGARLDQLRKEIQSADKATAGKGTKGNNLEMTTITERPSSSTTLESVTVETPDSDDEEVSSVNRGSNDLV